MAHEIDVEDPSVCLKSLIEEIQSGREVVFTQGKVPVEKLVAIAKPIEKTPRKAGFAKGLILYMADDFDAPLDDFKDYM